jgi:hypothetical protein
MQNFASHEMCEKGFWLHRLCRKSQRYYGVRLPLGSLTPTAKLKDKTAMKKKVVH